MPRYIGALRQTAPLRFTGSARLLSMSTRRHLRAQPALECGSLLPLYCQPACWLQIVFPVESPASKLDGRKAAASCRTPKPRPHPRCDFHAVPTSKDVFTHARSGLEPRLLATCHCPSIFAKCAIPEKRSSSFFRRRSLFCRTPRSSAITRTLSKNRSTAGRRVEITSRARP